MKLASLKNGTRDGQLVVVSRDLTRCTDASFLVPTLQAALDNWARIAPHLEALAESLEHGSVPSTRFHEHDAESPLPRAHQRANGFSAIVAPRDPIRVDQAGSVSVTGQVAVIVDDIAQGADAAAAREAIRLVMLAGIVSLGKQSGKGDTGSDGNIPFVAYSPVAVTPDELAGSFDQGRLQQPLSLERGGKPIEVGAGETADFAALATDVAGTRPLRAGAIIASDKNGPAVAGLQFGKTIRIEMKDKAGHSIFGAIEQKVEKA